MSLVLSSDGVPVLTSEGVQLIPAGGAVPLSNLSAATATPLSVGASLVLNVAYAKTPTTLWFVYRALRTGDVIFYAFGNLSYYIPISSVYVGSPDALTPYLSIQGRSVPLRVPTLAGGVYYFGVTGGLPDTLSVSLTQVPFVATTDPSALVLDMTPGFDAQLISINDGNTLDFVPFPAGRNVDTILSAGIILAEDTLVGGNTQLQLRDRTLQFVKAISRSDLSWPVNGELIRICSNKVDSFYVATEGTGSNAVQAAKISEAGVIGGTVWIIEGHGLSGIAVSPDETKMYYSHGGSAAVKVWDLTSNTGLSDLATAVSSYNTCDILAFPDGTVLVLYAQYYTVFARLYSAAGSTLMDYTLATDNSLNNRLAHDTDYASFLMVTHSSPSGVGHRVYTFIKLSDGSTVKTFSAPEYRAGALVSSPTT